MCLALITPIVIVIYKGIQESDRKKRNKESEARRRKEMNMPHSSRKNMR